MNRRRRFVPAACFAAWWLAAALTAQPIPDKDCLECHSDKDLAKTNATGQITVLFVDAAKLAASVHRTNLCSSCHADLKTTHPDDNVAAAPVACSVCHTNQSESFGASAHGVALKAGKEGAATCKDCHGTHEILPPTAPTSPLHWSKLAATCGECHPDAARDVQASVHGRAVAKGSREAATCTDCHSEHRIEGLKQDTPLQLAGQVCGKCHASERLNTKYRLPTDRVKTFFESYHGLAAQYGSTRAANCASCHGVHRILPSSDPNSSIHPAHLVETCGKCHPGASAKFALGKIHLNGESDRDTGAVVNRWVRRAYIALIVAVVGVLGLHNFLAWLKQALAAYRSQARSVVRMDRAQRLQHLVLLVSFLVLAWSGFALKYPESWLAWSLGADENIRRWTHRLAGVVLLGVGLCHLVYIWVSAEGRRLFRDLYPGRQDWRDVVANARYLLGRQPVRARFGRFGYPEKLEYWAVLWGTCIMGVTGLMIWLKIGVTQWLPRWVIDVAVTVHYYEAILACLAILVWHFYHVMFDPEVYPLNWAWWDGKVSAHWQQQEHPLEAAPDSAPPAEAKPVAGAPSGSPVPPSGGARE
jgi:formate dehydrogenase gamma subunit